MSTTTTEWQAPAVPEETQPEKGLDFLNAILSRKFLVVTCVIIGLVVGHLHFTRQPPVFASFAKVMVIRPPQVFDSEDRSTSRNGKSMNAVDMLENHIYLLTQPKILDGAINPVVDAAEVDSTATSTDPASVAVAKKSAKNKKDSIATLATLAASSNPTATIASGLRVLRSEVSEDVIEISFIGPNQGDCGRILEAVLASYQRWLQRTQVDSARSLRELLEQGRRDLETEIASNRKDYDDFRKGATLLFRENKGVNYYEDRLSKLENERHAKMIQVQQLEVNRNAIKEALARGASKEALLLMSNRVDSKGEQQSDSSAAGGLSIDPFMKEMMPLLLERETLLETVAEGHPQIRRLDKRIESLRSIFKEGTGANGEKPRDLLSIHVESLDERIVAMNREIEQLNAAFVKAKDESQALQSDMRKDEGFASNYARLQQLYDALVDKLKQMDLNQEALKMQADITSPPTPGIQIGPSMVQSLGFGGVGGLLAAVAIALLLETADKSFRNPDEISKQLRLPVIGHIPELAADRDWKLVKDAKVDSSISVHHRPKSRLAESYRAVRAAIFFGTRGQTHRVLQVTSANSGDGKTTLCANLASAIAMSGKKVLLVDCDLRRPRVHKLFGCNLDAGVSSVVRDGMDIPDAVQTTLVPNLDVMTVGPRVDNPAELLLSPQFSEMVLQLREKYDFVMMDTPPILIVTDPAAVAAHVDGVILVVRNTKRSRPQTRRVRETLDLIGARVLGVVVNGISERAAGYGYGDSYSYNYTSYRSGKGYYGSGGKYYSDERSGSYYEDSRKRR